MNYLTVGNWGEIVAIKDAWGGLRALIRNNFSFAQIKDLAGTAGLPVQRLSRLQQGSVSPASKGQLMDAVDGLFQELSAQKQDEVVSACVQQLLTRQPDLRPTVDEMLGQIGLRLVTNGAVITADSPPVEDQDSSSHLSPDEKLLLQTVFDHFHTEGVWPKWWKVGRELRHLDIPEVAGRLGLNLINAGSASDAEYNRGEDGQEAALTLLGLRLCDNSEEEVEDFMRVLELCLNRFLGDGDTPTVSSDDLRRQFGMSDHKVRQMYQLITVEPLIFNGGSSTNGGLEWQVNISPKIRRYRGVRSVDEYLARRPRLAPVGSIVPSGPGELPDSLRLSTAPANTSAPEGQGRIWIEPVFTGRGFRSDPSKVFVLHPFKDPFHAVYRDHIKPVVESLGLSCRRADDFYRSTSIIEDIWRGINEAGIVIADLTGKNPNVFYELGIAHTLGKEVILLTQDHEEVPFDLRHLRYRVYSTQLSGPRELEEDLRAVLGEIRGAFGEGVG